MNETLIVQRFASFQPMLRSASLLLAAAVLAGGVASQPRFASAADVIQDSDYSGVCSKERYLGRIKSRFRYQVSHVPDLPQVAIEEFNNIREVRTEPEDWKHPIGRQYCEADVMLSDGESRNIWYLIETDQGFASFGNNVEFCVSGFDRWYVYNGACRVLK